MDPILSTTIEINIPFFDVDAMGIIWHGHYVKYFELARCAFLDKIDYDYSTMKASGFAWPVVDLRIKYIRPILFKQRIIVEAALVEYENRLKIQYIIKDKLTQEKLTTGISIQVAVDMATEKLCFASPKILLDKLEAYL